MSPRGDTRLGTVRRGAPSPRPSPGPGRSPSPSPKPETRAQARSHGSHIRAPLDRAWPFASGRPKHTAPRAHMAHKYRELVPVLVAELVVFLWYLLELVTLCEKSYSKSLRKNTSSDKYHKKTTSFATSIGTSFDKFRATCARGAVWLGRPEAKRHARGLRPETGVEARDRRPGPPEGARAHPPPPWRAGREVTPSGSRFGCSCRALLLWGPVHRPCPGPKWSVLLRDPARPPRYRLPTSQCPLCDLALNGLYSAPRGGAWRAVGENGSCLCEIRRAPHGVVWSPLVAWRVLFFFQ